jgi:hypothetical protein
MRGLIWFVLRLRFLPSILFKAVRRAWCGHWEDRAARHLVEMVRSGRAGL